GRWAVCGRRRPRDHVPRPAGVTFEALRARSEAAGHEVLYADLTSRQAVTAGIHVVRVIVPGTVGAAPASCPYFGGRRVMDQAVSLGWRSTPCADRRLNTFPMPHA
ncbi:hypothetical protein DLE01_13520, partial [Streptomyces sp. FT05W]